MINAAWLADTLSAPIPLYWDDFKQDKPGRDPAGGARNESWARCSVRHTLGEQDTLGRIGQRRYLAGGNVTVQIFTPKGDGHRLGDQLVEIVKDALRQRPTTSQVWFFDISTPEVGVDGPWFNRNVEASFRYQEVA